MAAEEVVAVAAPDPLEGIVVEGGDEGAVVGARFDREATRLVEADRAVLGDVLLVQVVLVEA